MFTSSTSQTEATTQSDEEYSGAEYSIDETEATTQSDCDDEMSADVSEVILFNFFKGLILIVYIIYIEQGTYSTGCLHSKFIAYAMDGDRVTKKDLSMCNFHTQYTGKFLK